MSGYQNFTVKNLFCKFFSHADNAEQSDLCEIGSSALRLRMFRLRYEHQ